VLQNRFLKKRCWLVKGEFTLLDEQVETPSHRDGLHVTA
jgi:hypothetical protein